MPLKINNLSANKLLFKLMTTFEAFDEIYLYSHAINWALDWHIARNIYEEFPDSYSILTPFAYTYFEELIRSTTSEYGRELFDKLGQSKKRRKVGIGLLQLAKEENRVKRPELFRILSDIEPYFALSQPTNKGDNRNSVVHGYIHSRFWDQESFEKLIIDIARISKFAGF